MFKDGPGGGGSAVAGPFAHYPAEPGTIYSHADAITKQAGDLKTLNGHVTTKHHAAETGVSGALAGPLKKAPRPVRRNAAQVLRAALVGGGCVRYFGNAVSSFNHGVDKLNMEYANAAANDFGVTKPTPSGKVLPGDVRAQDSFNDDVAAAKADKLAELKKRYHALEKTLDGKATKTKSMLDKGPDDEKTILTLFGAGALPITAPYAFPKVNFKKADWRKALEQYAKSLPGGHLPDLTDQELKSWLKQHPELTSAVNWLLKQNGIKLSGFELDLVKAQARVDVMALKDGDGDIKDATVRLSLINSTAKGGGRINAASVVFIDQWVDSVGPDALTDLPDSYGKSELRPIANAILLRTNPDQLEPGASELPSHTIETLLRCRPGSYSDSPGRFEERLGQFNGWSKLLQSSTVEGGDNFSETLGHQAIQARQDMNAALISIRKDTDGAVPPELRALLSDDHASSGLMSVTARNQDASSRLLLDEDDRRAILGLNWNDASGAADVIESGTDRDGTDGSTLSLQRDAAKELMIDVAQHLDLYRGYTDGDGAVHGGIMTEGVSDAVIDVGATWGDTFLNPPVGHHDAQVDPGDLQLSAADQEGFLQFVGRDGTDDALRFQTGVEIHSQAELAQALRSGDQSAIQLALQRAGRFDGAMSDATFDGQYDQGADHALAAKLAEERTLKAERITAQLIKAGLFAAGPEGVAVAIGAEATGQIIDSVADDDTSKYDHELATSQDQLRENLQEGSPERKDQLLLAALSKVDGSDGQPIISQSEIKHLGTESAAAEAQERYEEQSGHEIKDNYHEQFASQFHPEREPREVCADDAKKYDDQAARARYGDWYDD